MMGAQMHINENAYTHAHTHTHTHTTHTPHTHTLIETHGCVQVRLGWHEDEARM